MIGQDLGPAGHRVAVPARFADHRRGLARDGRLVHGGSPFDDLAVRGNDLARGDRDDIPFFEAVRRDVLYPCRARNAAVRHGPGAGLAQRHRLRLAAPLGHGFREVGEQHREPEPQRRSAG